MSVWQDPKEGNWWMEFADNELVGYWPAHLFNHLADHASMVEWGGEIVNMEPGGGHTSHKWEVVILQMKDLAELAIFVIYK